MEDHMEDYRENHMEDDMEDHMEDHMEPFDFTIPKIKATVDFKHGFLRVTARCEQIDAERRVFRAVITSHQWLRWLVSWIPSVQLHTWLYTLILPPRVILKMEKDGWQREYAAEVAAYAQLQHVQGSLVPILYGQSRIGFYNTLILSHVAGRTLDELELDELVDTQTLKDQPTSDIRLRDDLLTALTEAYESLKQTEVLHGDPRVDNFIYEGGRIIIIDFDLSTIRDKHITHQAELNSLIKHIKNLARGLERQR